MSWINIFWSTAVDSPGKVFRLRENMINNFSNFSKIELRIYWNSFLLQYTIEFMIWFTWHSWLIQAKKNPVYDNALKKAFFELKYIRFKFIINLFDLILVSSFYKYILWSLKKVFQFKFIERNLSLEITILLQIIFHLENRFKTFFF